MNTIWTYSRRFEVNSSIVLMEKMKAAGYQPEELDENLIHMVAKQHV